MRAHFSGLVRACSPGIVAAGDDVYGPDAARATVRLPGDVRRPGEGARHPGRRDRGRRASRLAAAGAPARQRGLCLGHCPRRYRHGRGGPGGWWILYEPELHFGRRPGARSGRLAPSPYAAPARHGLLAAGPDWVCEFLSPATASLDRAKMLAIYAREGMAHAWLVDPLARTLEVLRLENGRWMILAIHAGSKWSAPSRSPRSISSSGRSGRISRRCPPPLPSPAMFSRRGWGWLSRT